MIICAFVAAGMLFIGQSVPESRLCSDRKSMLPSYTTNSMTFVPVPHLSGVEVRNGDGIAILKGCDSPMVVVATNNNVAVIVHLQTCEAPKPPIS